MSELGAGLASVWESLGLDVLALVTGHLSTQDRVCLASSCTALRALCKSEQLQLWRDASVQLQREAQLQHLLTWLEAKRAEVQCLRLSVVPQLSVFCFGQDLGCLTALTRLTLSEPVYLPDPEQLWEERCRASRGPTPLPLSLPSSLQELSACLVRPALPAGVAAATQLRALTLFCGSFDWPDTTGLQQLRQLTALKLDCTWADEAQAELDRLDDDRWDGGYEYPYYAQLPQLAALTALRSLSLAHLRGLEGCDKWLPALQSLTALHLPFCEIGDFPRALSTLTGLEDLSLAGMGRDAPSDTVSIDALIPLTRLSRLDLRNCGVFTSASDQIISGLVPALKELDMTEALIRKPLASTLLSRPQLTRLRLSPRCAALHCEALRAANQLVRVDLHLYETVFCDAIIQTVLEKGMAVLASLPRLEEVGVTFEKAEDGLAPNRPPRLDGLGSADDEESDFDSDYESDCDSDYETDSPNFEEHGGMAGHCMHSEDTVQNEQAREDLLGRRWVIERLAQLAPAVRVGMLGTVRLREGLRTW